MRMPGAGAYLVRISLSLLVWRRRYTRSPWRIRISRWPRSSCSLLSVSSTDGRRAGTAFRVADEGRLRTVIAGSGGNREGCSPPMIIIPICTSIPSAARRHHLQRLRVLLVMALLYLLAPEILKQLLGLSSPDNDATYMLAAHAPG